MTQETPGKNLRPWSWLQFGISLGLITVGLLTFWLGVGAGFGGNTGIAVIDSVVGNGQVFCGIGPLIFLIGVLWMAARIYRVGILMYGKRPTFPEILKWITRN